MKRQSQRVQQQVQKQPKQSDNVDDGDQAEIPNAVKEGNNQEQQLQVQNEAAASLVGVVVVAVPPANSGGRRRRLLPLELNCELFAWLPIPGQRRLLPHLGQGICKMYRKKTKRKWIIWRSCDDLRARTTHRSPPSACCTPGAWIC